jgi:hypothetical protein
MQVVDQRADADKVAIRGSTESQTAGGSWELPQIDPLHNVNRVFGKHLRLSDTRTSPSRTCAMVSIGFTVRS